MGRGVVKAEQAPSPEAVTTVQRPLLSRLAYPRRTRSVDAWHGRRDRGLVESRAGRTGADEPTGALVVDTVYLQGIGRECAGHLEPEFLQTAALLHEIDGQLAAARQALDEARENADRAAAQAPDPAQVATDGPEIVAKRLDGEKAKAAAAAAAAAKAVAGLLEARRLHWAGLQRRTAEALAYFDQRAATYADHATRRVRTPVAPVRVARPAWVGAPLPEPGHLESLTFIGG